MENGLFVNAIAIVPKLIPVAALKAAVDACLNETANQVRDDFQRTTATWTHDVAFTVVTRPWERMILTQDAIYGYVNKGTRPHTITAKGRALVFQVPYAAKSSPGIVASRSGSKGGQTVYTRQVNHPGSAARDFDKTIAETYLALFPARMQQYLRAAVRP